MKPATNFHIWNKSDFRNFTKLPTYLKQTHPQL